jgi:hypothetical protein
MKLFPFEPEKKLLMRNCNDQVAYFLKNEHIYRRLYPDKPDSELRRLAMYDWNELARSHTRVYTKGKEHHYDGHLDLSEDAELLSGLGQSSLFHKDSIILLSQLNQLMLEHVSRVNFFSRKMKKKPFRQLVQNAIEFIQPSMHALHNVELSRQEQLSQFFELVRNDVYVRKALKKVDRKVLAGVTLLDVQKKIKSDISQEELTRNFIALIEQFRCTLERQNFALHEILIELNKEKPSMKQIRKNCHIFNKSVPELNRYVLFFQKLDRTNFQLLMEVKNVRENVDPLFS